MVGPLPPVAFHPAAPHLRRSSGRHGGGSATSSKAPVAGGDHNDEFSPVSERSGSSGSSGSSSGPQVSAVPLPPPLRLPSSLQQQQQQQRLVHLGFSNMILRLEDRLEDLVGATVEIVPFDDAAEDFVVSVPGDAHLAPVGDFTLRFHDGSGRSASVDVPGEVLDSVAFERAVGTAPFKSLDGGAMWEVCIDVDFERGRAVLLEIDADDGVGRNALKMYVERIEPPHRQATEYYSQFVGANDSQLLLQQLQQQQEQQHQQFQQQMQQQSSYGEPSVHNVDENRSTPPPPHQPPAAVGCCTGEVGEGVCAVCHGRRRGVVPLNRRLLLGLVLLADVLLSPVRWVAGCRQLLRLGWHVVCQVPALILATLHWALQFPTVVFLAAQVTVEDSALLGSLVLLQHAVLYPLQQLAREVSELATRARARWPRICQAEMIHAQRKDEHWDQALACCKLALQVGEGSKGCSVSCCSGSTWPADSSDLASTLQQQQQQSIGGEANTTARRRSSGCCSFYTAQAAAAAAAPPPPPRR